MRGLPLLVVAVVLAQLGAGCAVKAPVPLADLLVRADEMPAGWRLMDFNADEDPNQLTYPMGENPAAFDAAQLEVVGWNGSTAARAIAFTDGAGGIVMVWAETGGDAAYVERAVTGSCLAADDVVLVSGRNLAYAAAYTGDARAAAASGLDAAGERTGARNACPKDVARQVAGAPDGVWGVATGVALAPNQRATFRFTLEAPANVTLARDAFLHGRLLAGDLRTVAEEDDLAAPRLLPAGTYLLRLTSVATTTRTFTFSHDGPQDPGAGGHGH